MTGSIHLRICATKGSGGDCGDTSGFRTLLHGPHKPDSRLGGNGQRFGRRGDISNLVVALSATSKSPLDIYCHSSETFPHELLRSIRSVFTASAWPEQVLFWSADYPREAADSLVRRLPFGELGALAARALHRDLVGAVSEEGLTTPTGPQKMTFYCWPASAG
jgi:hypothetical protein